jgi:hypothetical protein
MNDADLVQLAADAAEGWLQSRARRYQANQGALCG